MSRVPSRDYIGLIIAVAAGILLALVVIRTMSDSGGTRTANDATYHVSPVGNDANDGRSEGRPLATIQHALQAAGPGDVIQLHEGTYPQSFETVRPGTKERPIVIRGPEQAVVTGSQSRIIQVLHDHIHLTGFTVDGRTGEGDSKDDYRDKLIYAIGTQPQDGVEGLRIHKMNLRNAGGECVRLRYFARNNEISHSRITDCGIYDFVFADGGKNGEGIYIGTAPEQLDDGKNPTADTDRSQNNHVHHNVIRTNGNECVDIKEGSTRNLIEHNICSGQLDDDSGGLDARGSYNIFRYNTISDTEGAGIRLGGDEPGDGIGNDVYGNVLRDIGTYGIKVQRGGQGRICGNSYDDVNEEPIGGDAVDGLEPRDCD